MPLNDPWFWAFLAALGWGSGCGAFFGIPSLGRRLEFGIPMFILAEVPRVLLPLHFVVQPRIVPNPSWVVWVGILIFAGSLVFGTPVFRIIPLRAPDSREPLRTDGLYAVVRHPLMLCDILWPLGWSLIFGSVIGVVLTPVWLLVIWGETYLEEESLVREYGDAYRQFQSRVPRLFPR
ncbi:MAG: isoprenylcysteine carboxylmethyltransferase family protein, partial [Candidatus Binatus sp.]